MFEVETSNLFLMEGGRQEAEAIAPEAALVASACAGDREAFARLYDMYAPLVHGVLLARVDVRRGIVEAGNQVPAVV